MMKINTNSTASAIQQKVSFQGRAFNDSHGHVGTFTEKDVTQNFNYDYFEKNIPEIKNDDLKKIFVSDLSGILENNGVIEKNEIDANKQVLEFCSEHPKFEPIAVCQPGRGGDASNIENLIKQNPNRFKALKFHPEVLKVNANDPKFYPYFKLAEKYNLPCAFHTQEGFAAVEKICDLARKYKKVPVVLYHMNFAPAGKWEQREVFNMHGVEIAKNAISEGANVYLETSWTRPETVVEAIKRVGADRVLFGTDAPFLEKREDGCSTVPYREQVERLENAIKKAFPENSEEILDKVFYKNSEKLFLSAPPEETLLTKFKNFMNSKKEKFAANKNLRVCTFIGLGVLAVAGIFIQSKKNIKYTVIPARDIQPNAALFLDTLK